MEPTEKGNENVIKRILKNVCEKEEMKNYIMKITALPCTSINYSGTLFRATVTGDGIDKLHLFAKVGNSTEKSREHIPVIEMFERESFVYQEITKIYEDIQENYKVPEEERFKFCKFYACNDKLLEETIILEDLTTLGYYVSNRFKSINWEYAQKAVTELAKFHALSFSFEREQPDIFQKIVKTKSEYILSRDRTSEEETRKMQDTLFESVSKVTYQENFDKLEKYRNNKFSNDLLKKQFEPRSRNVLVHGDFRKCNILIKQKGGKITSLIPVDYQAVYYGCPANDLLYLIYSGSDKEFRIQHYDALLKHYYKKLGDFLFLLKLNVNEVYPEEELKLDIKERFEFVLLFSIVVLPFILFEGKPNLEGNLPKFPMTTDSVYAKRFNDILEEYFDKGYLEM